MVEETEPYQTYGNGIAKNQRLETEYKFDVIG